MFVSKNGEVKKCWGVEVKSVSGDCKDDFVKKSRIGRWKLAEVEDQIFGWDCRGGCMHKQDCENEGALTIL